MDFLTLVYFAIWLSCSFGNASDCKPSVAPPDIKSGCCGRAVGVDKSIPGLNAQLSEYPWMGILEYRKENKSELSCSATLISGRYMLSAAQCFGNWSTETSINVRLGEYNIDNDGPDCVEVGGSLTCNDGVLKIPIDTVIKHPDYNQDNNYQHDIALIRLAQTAPITDFIQPICLPSSDITDDLPSFRMWAAGWGVIDGNESGRARLRHVVLPYVDLQTCQKAYNASAQRQLKLGSGQLCAGGEGKDTCRGDSGAPLMYARDQFTTEVVGIASFGPKRCGVIGTPSVYTKVFAYDAWIRENIKE